MHWTAIVYLGCAAIYLCASFVVAWVAGEQIGSKTDALRVSGHDLSWILGLLGVSSAALKALIPLETARTGSLVKCKRLPALSFWVMCLLYSWSAALFAASQLKAVASMPLAFLVFFSGAWGLVEIGSALLPAVAWAAINKDGNDGGGISRETSPRPTDLPVPVHRDLVELLHRTVNEGRPPRGVVGIQLEPDGTILTTQSALARALGQSKATVHRRLHALCISGAITLATDAGTTRISLPTMRPVLAA